MDKNPRFAGFVCALTLAALMGLSSCNAEKQQKPKVEAAAATLLHAAAPGS